MKEWLCYQSIVTKEELIGNTNNIGVDTIIRLVEAKTKEEAMGKFLLNTKDVKAVKKLDVECFEINKILKIL